MDNNEKEAFLRNLPGNPTELVRASWTKCLNYVSYHDACDIYSDLVAKYEYVKPNHFVKESKKRQPAKTDKGIPPHAFEIDGNPIHLSKDVGGRTVIVDPNDVPRVDIEHVAQKTLEMARRQSSRQIDIKWMPGFEIQDPF